MGKRIYSLLLAVIMILTMTAISVSASEITDTTEDHLIEVTGKFEEAAASGGTYIGYNINGFDAYPYTFEEGDVLEYEVYLETATPGTGHVEIQGSKLVSVDAEGNENHKWEFLRMVCNRDTEKVQYAPSADLTSVAYKQWYKRSVSIPKAFVGFTARHIYLMVECYEMPAENEFHFYIKNVRIVGADGEVKQDICSNDTEFIVGQLVEVSPAGTLSMELNPIYPEPEETEPDPTEKETEPNEVTEPQESGIEVTQPQNSQPGVNNADPENKLDTGLIIAIAAAVVVIIGIVVFVAVKKKVKNKH